MLMTPYLNFWNQLDVNNKFIQSMIESSIAPIKVRVLDQQWKPYYYMLNDNNCILCQSSSSTLFTLKNITYKKMFAISKIDDKYRHLRIAGLYFTKTHLVLCGPPEVKTLKKIYNTNKLIAMHKLRTLIKLNTNHDEACNEIFKIIHQL